MENQGRSQSTSKLHIIPMTFPEFLIEDSFPDLEKYKKSMVTTIKFLKQTNESVIEKDMNQVLDNERMLSKLSKSEYSSDDENEEITLDKMNKLMPSVNWIEFVNNVMGNPTVKVTGSEIVLIPGERRLVKIYKFINDKLTKREQANLLLWRIYAKYSGNFFRTGTDKEALHKNKFDTNGASTSRPENCVNQIKTFFPRILDDLIINNHLQPDDKKKVKRIFRQLKDELKDSNIEI